VQAYFFVLPFLFQNPQAFCLFTDLNGILNHRFSLWFLDIESLELENYFKIVSS